MSDPLNDPKTWFQGFLTFFSGILTFMFRAYVQKQEDHGKRLELLERNCVTREDLEKMVEQMRADRRAMHEENRADLRTLIADLGQVKETVSHLEGQLSGRYPRMER